MCERLKMMNRSSPITAAMLIGAALMLSGYSGGGRVVSGPAIVPYVCEDGRPISAIYEHGGDFLHAKVLITYDGRTTELEAAPTLYGIRYTGEAGEGGQPLAWSLRGERAWLSEVTDAADVANPGRPIAQCTRQRSTGGEAGHSEGEH